MDIQKLGVHLVSDNKNYRLDIDLTNDIKECTLHGAKLLISKEQNIIGFSFVNCSTEGIILNALDIHIATISFDNSARYISNHEDPTEDIELNSIETSKEIKEFTSYLFGILMAEGYFGNYFFGFLSTHTSKNYIRILVKDKNIEVHAVYNFGVHKLLPDEILTLDTLYIEEGNNSFNAFNNYIASIAASCNYSEVSSLNLNIKRSMVNDKEDQYNFLFTKKPIDCSVKMDNKPVTIKVNKEKLYPVDISTEEGQKMTLEKVSELKEQNGGIVFIKNVNNYLEGILNLKCFNPYFYFNNLLILIMEQLEDIKFYFDNCPIGIAIGNNAILEQELKLNEKQGILKKIVKKKERYSINYNFIIKLLLKRAILSYNTKFNVNNAKFRVLLELITGCAASSNENFEKLDNIKDDIDTQLGIIPYIQSENVFGFIARGKEAIYMAVFNMSETHKKFYWDVSMEMGEVDLNGVINEVFTDTNYLVSNGKVYIRSFPAMDCFLFKKKLA